jgi:hypothetical protein
MKNLLSLPVNFKVTLIRSNSPSLLPGWPAASSRLIETSPLLQYQRDWKCLISNLFDKSILSPAAHGPFYIEFPKQRKS